MNIDRTLFWFKDGDEKLTSLSDDFFGLGTLLNRLLNEKYDGKKIKFINLDFFTEKTYELHPMLLKQAPYYYGGHLRYYGIFDINKFNSLEKIDQVNFIWKEAHSYLIESANAISNRKLAESADYAYTEGLKIALDTKYKVLDNQIIVLGKHVRASISIIFDDHCMYSKLSLKHSGHIILDKELDKTKKGVEIFLDMYKAIVVEGNEIVIKGRKDVESLPIRIPFSEIIIP
jgi:hypothetical protein